MIDQIVRIDNLHRHFGERAALDGVTLDIARGTVLGLVGENGAGKTTLIKHLLGLMQPQQGSVTVFGLTPTPVCSQNRVGHHDSIDFVECFVACQAIRKGYRGQRVMGCKLRFRGGIARECV